MPGHRRRLVADAGRVEASQPAHSGVLDHHVERGGAGRPAASARVPASQARSPISTHPFGAFHINDKHDSQPAPALFAA
jgi:hypothetical protein